MHPVIKYCFVVAIGLSANAALAETQGTKASRVDEMFIKEAMQGDLAEVNMGKLAQEKAQSEGVKELWQNAGGGSWRAFAKGPRQGAGTRRHPAPGAQYDPEKHVRSSQQAFRRPVRSTVRKGDGHGS